MHTDIRTNDNHKFNLPNNIYHVVKTKLDFACDIIIQTESRLVNRYPRFIVFRNLGKTCLETYREEGALSLIKTAAKVICIVGFTLGALAATIYFVAAGIFENYNKIGQRFTQHYYVNHIHVGSDYNAYYTFIDCLLDSSPYLFWGALSATIPIALGYAACLDTSQDPFFKNLKKCYSTDSTS